MNEQKMEDDISMQNQAPLNRRWTRVLAFIFCISLFNELACADDALRAGFQTPPAAAKARTWWHWINGNVSKDGITKDLEAMKAAGVQETQIFSVNLNDPKGPATYLSPRWLDMFQHAATESKRLGLELGFHNGPGWSSSGGPWVTPEHAMQTVVFSETAHAGGTLFNDRLPKPKTRLDFYRDIAVLAFPKPTSKERIDDLDFKSLSGRIRNHLAPDAKVIPVTARISMSDVVDLTDKLAEDGTLQWDAPAGDWIILRLGHTPNGARNRPAPFGGQGLECDKMSREAVDAFWNDGIDPIIKKLGPLVGTVLTNCVIDSYEVGTTNWTTGFEEQFKQLRGYDCKLFLPTLAGYYVESGEVSERFLWDFRRTIGDMIAENYYAHFRTLCHQHGMKLSVEPYWGPFDNMQVGATGDIVMCEFWSGDVAFFDTPKFAASIAKLNGDSIVGAEAFTGEGGWIEHPATIKSIGDRAWAQGINRFIFHSYVHQPWDVGPGLTLSYHGLEFNRLNTWWEPGAAFLDYIARGQFLLQQGQSVADVLVFVGEASPNTALLMPEIKAMGYDYDLIATNKLDSLTVSDDGAIRTTTGATYRALVLPKTNWMKPETVRKLEELAEAGARILGPKPVKSPSLTNFPECDEQVSQIADKLWGKGLISDRSIVNFLTDGAIPPDFGVENGNTDGLDFIHRNVDDADIYFVANARKEKRLERCRFRVTEMQPELWNAETGEIMIAPVWQANDDGTTSVPIQFEAEGSVFVVFRKPAASSDHIVETTMDLEPTKSIPLPDLEIISAEYGAFLQDGLINVTQALADGVKNNQLDAIAGRELSDFDPAPGYKKELRVKYMVGDVVHETSVRERESVKIDATGQGELKIVRAIYGKFHKGVVGVPSTSLVQNVAQKIQSLVASGVLEIPVNNRLASGSFAQEKSNELHIVYSTAGRVEKRSILDGDKLSLSTDRPDPAFVVENGAAKWVTPYPGELTFSSSSGESKTIRVKTVPEAVEVTGPWDVNFPTNQGTAAQVTFEELTSWSSSSDQRVRHFSGTATYKNRFDLPKQLINAETSLELDLGAVRVIAEVIVNGNNLGILWKAPFRVKLDGLVNEGANTLEVKVTNLWPNRLIGDAYLPNDIQRKGRGIKKWPDWLVNQTNRASGRVGFPAYKHWSKDSVLQSSGLLGPVIVRSYACVKIENR